MAYALVNACSPFFISVAFHIAPAPGPKSSNAVPVDVDWRFHCIVSCRVAVLGSKALTLSPSHTRHTKRSTANYRKALASFFLLLVRPLRVRLLVQRRSRRFAYCSARLGPPWPLGLLYPGPQIHYCVCHPRNSSLSLVKFRLPEMIPS